MPDFYRRILRPALFRLDPETAHATIGALAFLARVAPLRAALAHGTYENSPALASTLWGLRFTNPVGIGAGFDKSARLYPLLAAVGFGFVEQGTFTAVPQRGNPRPRVFRFPEQEAIVNRMGFNNPGASVAARRIAAQRTSVPRGISIGKSRSAAPEDAIADQARALGALAAVGDYVALNVSSPNTPGLRDLQTVETLRAIVSALRVVQDGQPRGRLPLLLKLAPDFAVADFELLVGSAQDVGVDGLILTNTTLARDRVPRARDVAGGLSGAPLRDISTAWVRRAHLLTAGRLPIVGVGGIFSAEHALEKIAAGASLVELYTGYIYEGPGLPKRINRGLAAVCKARGVTLGELVGSESQ
jgi:dihydroorotate dehydrogenase